MERKEKIEQTAKKIQNLGKTLTLCVTIPIISFVFFGLWGLGISLGLILLIAIANK